MPQSPSSFHHRQQRHRNKENMKSARKVIKETDTQGKQVLPILPQEIIEDILKRLPVESLVRFSCTCKRWLSLIFRDPKFNKAHIDHAKRPSWKMLEIRDSRKLLRRSIDCDCNIFTPSRKKPRKYLPYHPIRVLGSCNGILFLEGYYGRGISDPSKEYVLWNPYTNSIKRIDNHDVKGKVYSSISGLSYDRTTDDFKAISVLEDCLGKRRCPYVFSLRRNSWKLVDSPNVIGLNNNDTVGITLDNGICHWVIDHWKNELDCERVLSIICFDPVVEKFKGLPLPDKLCPRPQIRIGSLDGCLSLIHKNSIWVMKEYGCWTELYVLHEVSGSLAFLQVDQLAYKPIGYNSNKDQVLVIRKDYPSCIEIADLKEGVVKEPSDKVVKSINVSTVVPYTESLLCPWLGL